jgi:hypothetical protein
VIQRPLELVVGGIWGSLEIQTREALKCYTMINGLFCQNSEDPVPTGIQIIKTVLMRFQMGTRTPSGIELEAIPATFWQIIYLHFVHTLTFFVRLSLKEIVNGSLTFMLSCGYS